MNKFWASVPEVQNELEVITDIIHSTNKMGNGYLKASVQYLFGAEGKMLRPAFVLIGSQFGQVESQHKLHQLAAAVEILHSATLIHDDIVDEAKMRRNQLSIQGKYSKEYAVYMGDFFFSQCFMMLAEYEVSMDVMKYMARGVNTICRGEMLQNAMRYNDTITTRHYLKIITGKTAALFAASLSVGAKEAGASQETVKLLGKIGRHVGMAFQLIDDLLDYESTAEIIGKDVQADIVKGYYSLPIIKALASDYRTEMKVLLQHSEMAMDQIKRLIELTRKSGGVDHTRQLAEKYTQKSLKGIQQLPEGRGKELLKAIVPKLLKRKY